MRHSPPGGPAPSAPAGSESGGGGNAGPPAFSPPPSTPPAPPMAAAAGWPQSGSGQPPSPPSAPDSWDAMLSAEPPSPHADDPWAAAAASVGRLDDPEQELWTAPEPPPRAARSTGGTTGMHPDEDRSTPSDPPDRPEADGDRSAPADGPVRPRASGAEPSSESGSWSAAERDGLGWPASGEEPPPAP